MIPVYQTVFSNSKGNCLAAVWASLLDKKIDDIPNFVEDEEYFEAMKSFLKPFGFTYQRYLINGNRVDLTEKQMEEYQHFKDVLPDHGHVNGFYEATVYSPGYFDEAKYFADPSYQPVYHAVIIDKDFKIIHDPNPRYKGIENYPLSDMIGYNGVIGVSLWHSIVNKQLINN